MCCRRMSGWSRGQTHTLLSLGEPQHAILALYISTGFTGAWALLVLFPSSDEMSSKKQELAYGMVADLDAATLGCSYSLDCL